MLVDLKLCPAFNVMFAQEQLVFAGILGRQADFLNSLVLGGISEDLCDSRHMTNLFTLFTLTDTNIQIASMAIMVKM